MSLRPGVAGTVPVSGDMRLSFFFLCLVLAWTATVTADNATTATPTPTPTLSGCQVCASSGDCSHAYLDAPGQFCGNWLDQANQRQRCCCPREALCRLSNYECRCSWTTPSPTKTAKTAKVSSSGWVGVGAFMFLGCCTGVGFCVHRAFTRGNNRQHPAHATAVPVAYGQPTCNVTPMPMVYGAPPIQYPYAGVPTAPVYGYGYGNEYGNHHHHSSGISTGLGAVAGLVTGMVVADAMFDSGHNHGDYGRGGYDGGGGGFDGGGDLGGGGGGDFGGDF